MDGEGLLETLKEYQEKLNQVEQALSVTPPGEDRDNLQELKDNITLLINLSQQGIEPDQSASTSTSNDSNLQDEYSLFMAEMVKEGAIETTKANDIEEELKDLEGMKCRAPHEHSWGDIVYHNALICTVIESEDNDYENIIVKIMYTNPTHKEMLPCPYFLESDCKFSDDKCRFSHGELVHFSKLQEYIEPDYENLIVGSFVLAKQSDNLWYRATIKRIFPEKCLVKFDSNNKEVEIELTNIFPTNECNDNYESEDEKVDVEDVINMSLMNPVTEKIGDWEKYTKGVGSKLMEKMGYVIGTGLGKRADGIINPVSAVVLPPGKSLDHCMELRENAGGDKNLFSVERKLKRLQRKQEKKNQKIYEKETKKVDVFKFLNNTIYNNKPKDTVTISKSEHRKEIKKESCRNLNVESLKIDESIREVEKDLFKISESLQRHKDPKSQVHKQLKKKLCDKQIELESLKSKALNIKNEQTVRSDKKKLTVF